MFVKRKCERGTRYVSGSCRQSNRPLKWRTVHFASILQAVWIKVFFIATVLRLAQFV